MSKHDVVNTVSTALATGAVLLQIFVAVVVVLALAALVFAPARRALLFIREVFLGTELWFAWAFAAIAMAGSLFFSEYAGFLVCRLCWYERICMYPLVAVLLAGALRRDTRAAVQYAFLLPIFGAGVAIYHVYIELHPEAELQTCREGVSCATKWIDEFGYVTIPVLALSAFAMIGVLLAFVWSRRHEAEAV